MSITVELVVVATSSSPSLLFSFASTSCCPCGSPAVGCDSGRAGGEPEAGEAGDAGEAGEAGETGDGGDVGKVGDGGERGGDGGSWLACTSPSRLSWLSGNAGAAGGSGLFSAMLIRSSSWVGACFWACTLTSY